MPLGYLKFPNPKKRGRDFEISPPTQNLLAEKEKPQQIKPSTTSSPTHVLKPQNPFQIHLSLSILFE